MSRRRRKDPNTPKLLGLEDAINSNLHRLEQAVAYQTVLRNFTFTPEELIACVLAPEDIETLRRAEPLVQAYHTNRVHCSFVRDSLATTCATTCPFVLTIDIDGMGLALWRDGACTFQHDAPRAADLLKMVGGLSYVRQRFAAVRTLVEWFDKHASWGAVRYYWPSACALLPNDHLIHRMDGTTFREPKISIGNMIPLCRETAMTIAEAMLCPLEIPPSGKGVSVPMAGTIPGMTFDIPLRRGNAARNPVLNTCKVSVIGVRHG